MICNECLADKPGPDLDGLPVADVARLCREWRCQKCSRTPEQVQSDFVAASAKELHEPAHDWDAIAQQKAALAATN